MESACRQRVQFHALVERCARDGPEIVAKGFATRVGAADRALVFSSGVGCGRCEAFRSSGQIVHLIRLPVSPVLRLRVQFLIDRLAPEDRGGFLCRG